MRQNLTREEQDRINEELLDAAKKGNLELCESLLAQGANPNITNHWKSTALHYAARNDNIAVCLRLLKTIEDVNLQGYYGRTPLHYAAKNGNFGLFEALIKKGADPKITDGSQNTSLHYAAKSNHIAMCLNLLETIEDVNLQGAEEMTPLHYAAQNGNFELFEALIKKGADPNIIDRLKKTSLHYATERNHTVICLKLLEITEDVNLQDKDGKIPLHYVAQNGNFELFEVLINKGANPNITDASQNTSLHYAAKRDYTTMCLKLLGAIEDVNLQGGDKMTLLHYAAGNRNLELCQSLLAQGANSNIADHRQRTPLHLAVHNNNVELLRLLISEGAIISDDLINDIPANIRTEADTLYREKLAKERLLIDEIGQQVQTFITNEPSATLEGDALSNIFASIKNEIRGGYFKVMQIEKLLEILASYLEKIKNNELGTTGIFQHHLRKHFQEMTEPLIKNKIVNIIGRNLENFRYDHVNKGDPIPRDALGHVASFFDLSELGALNALSLTEGYQLATDELKKYRSDLLSQADLLVSSDFLNNVIIPMGERQDIFPNILANNHLQREKQRAKNRDADFEVIDHGVEERIETEELKDIERAQEAKREDEVRAKKIARLSEAVIKAFQNDSPEDSIFLDLVARDKSLREDIYAQISRIAAEGELTDVQASLSKWQQICASSADPTTLKEQPRSQVTENDQAEIEDSGGDRMVDAINREKLSSFKESPDLYL